MSPETFAFILEVTLSPPSADDRTADALRLQDRLRHMGIHPVRIPLNILRRLPMELRENGFKLHLVIGCEEVGFRLLDIKSGPIYGIAVDIGTTTLECALYELATKKKMGEFGVSNPQIAFGADVLSRVQLAMTGKGRLLSESLREGVNRLIAGVCEGNGVSTSDVYALTVAGNTIMSHFFLDLDLDNIPVSPNIPVVSDAFYCSASDLGISIFSEAAIYVFPNAGSYVGGDIISGMIHTELQKAEEPVLFMDVGTNVEITLGCRDWIMVGAGAAGPALEGGVADIGRKAEKGTISSVKIDRLTGSPELVVISGGEPEGICGSGLTDLVAELFENRIIDQAGRFNKEKNGVVLRDGEPAYLLYYSGGRELIFRERELQNFLRSKAAMFAFLYVFLRSVGMKIGDIERFYLSGALGCGINIESAVKIGMLPDIQRHKIVPINNSSLKGASMLLLDSSLIEEVRHLLSLITYREMAEDADLLNILQGALFIPHTDPRILKV